VNVAGLSGETSTQTALEYIASRAPGDVLLTLTWLKEAGWHPTMARIWEESFGDADIDFRRADAEVRIIRDRGQWMLSLRMADWTEWIDLELVLDAKGGRTEWDEPSGNPYENSQLPVGVEWAETVPGAIQWLTTTEDVESKLNALKAERFRQRFPGWRSPG
jgi:hypothetical protein